MVTEVPTPLSGVRVLDFTRFVSGSYASQMLAGMGAEVLKIEVPPEGDPYRGQGAVRIDGESVLFMTLNRGKKSVAIDFRAPESAEMLKRMVEASDVIMENSRPGSLKRHGLDYESISARYPHIVYGSVSGFGAHGPSARRGGFDLILQAESGLMSVTGHPECGPAKVGAPVTDVGAGLACVTGVVAALYERTRTGKGRHVTTSLLEFALSSLATLATASFVTHDPPGLMGSHSPTFAPYGVYRTADGWIALAGAGSDEMWLRLCDALDLEVLTNDPRFVDNGSRVRNNAELSTEIEQRTSERPTGFWQGLLDERGVPCARIADVDEAFSSDQVSALGMVEEVEAHTGALYTDVGAPLEFDGTRPASLLPAPGLGEHTRDVLVALGASETELDELVAAGVAIA